MMGFGLAVYLFLRLLPAGLDPCALPCSSAGKALLAECLTPYWQNLPDELPPPCGWDPAATGIWACWDNFGQLCPRYAAGCPDYCTGGSGSN
jgi:hypothetical protein